MVSIFEIVQKLDSIDTLFVLFIYYNLNLFFLSDLQRQGKVISREEENNYFHYDFFIVCTEHPIYFKNVKRL